MSTSTHWRGTPHLFHGARHASRRDHRDRSHGAGDSSSVNSVRWRRLSGRPAPSSVGGVTTGDGARSATPGGDLQRPSRTQQPHRSRARPCPPTSTLMISREIEISVESVRYCNCPLRATPGRPATNITARAQFLGDRTHAAMKIVARVLPGAQLQETAHTLACAAGLGPSLVRRPPYGDPLPVPSPRPTDVLPPGRAIYLVR
jgi:hypothetical protein